MSVDVRPEYIEGTDNPEEFFGSGKVPQFNCSTSTFGELLDLVGYLPEDMDSAGFLPAGEIRRGAEEVLERVSMSAFHSGRMVSLLEVATWAENHGRRVEWC